MFRLCVTAVIKKAARRCFTVTNPEVRLLKTMSSPQLDIENATNLKDKICDTIPTATSAPDRSVSGSVSDRVIDVVVDSESNDNASDSVASKLPGADAKQPTEEEIPSVLSKRAARRVRFVTCPCPARAQRRQLGDNIGRTRGRTDGFSIECKTLYRYT